ncbi:MAG: NAD-dependent DNA ligase LigA [Saprospiraceae bacterium]|nr:NAD-dependent DNA ligase LigA [Saprospiraceae bacterium]MCF8251340.1 NAD-dependent DNA ligase LigA [Saprospiraceae bacterium]MCF8280641.1 NAD-dependent DNA ligase LigA [Bacteroidales bacterium]MCF8313215.1 NAD-dependent DNA ligase LigA [Saprospiraceae bacterium]MCF8441621.1 NAD-dependent DNA ligase LigA [Saprospiraceae bacterium]
MYSKEEQRRLFDLSKKLLAQPEPTDASSISELRETIIYHEWRYYALNDPVVSDFEYDMLYKKLQAIEAAHPQLVTPESPTQRVSSDLTEEFNLVEHLTPMLSLDNSYDAEDLKEFDERIKNYLGLPADLDIEYCVEPKFDGGTIALVYENDQLVRAATRGNGALGDEITANIRTLRSVPLRAEFSKFGIAKAELRGEALIRKDVFVKMNEQRAADELTLFANPRNAATGGLRTKDPSETASRRIEAFIYQLGYAVDANGNNAFGLLKSHDDTIDLLGKLGFKIPQDTPPNLERKVCKNITEVAAFCVEWQNKRESYGYEIDGMVVKANSLELQQRTGSTAHHPRWAIAFKFKAKQATTKLLNVEFQVGKIGSITPVAKLEPVALAGVTVSSVSLHNEDFIRNKDLRLGDTVLVERAGDVIPYIVKPMEELRDGSEQEIVFPTNCPVCQTQLVRAEDEAAWRCENPDCEAQVIQRMIYHVSKNAMDIDGFGESQIERFFRLGWLRNIADIYRLDYEAIAQLEGFGEKSANNLRAAIEKAKKNPIHRLLHSLTIHHLGIKAGKILAAEVQNIWELKDWDEERFRQIKDIGPVVTHNVIRFFQHEKNVEILKEMESLGVNFTQTEEDRPKAVNADAPLVGKTILFTGTLMKMGRKEAQAKAEAAGAKNTSAVSGNLDYLIVGEDAGSKLKKATALGTVTIMTEDEFLELVGG